MKRKTLRYLHKSLPSVGDNGETSQIFPCIHIHQFFSLCRKDEPNPFRMFPKQDPAAFALGKSTQSRKISTSKQNGTSYDWLWVIFRSIRQPEKLSLCFFLSFAAG